MSSYKRKNFFEKNIHTLIYLLLLLKITLLLEFHY